MFFDFLSSLVKTKTPSHCFAIRCSIEIEADYFQMVSSFTAKSHSLAKSRSLLHTQQVSNSFGFIPGYGLASFFLLVSAKGLNK
jgi:hypothetical protein